MARNSGLYPQHINAICANCHPIHAPGPTPAAVALSSQRQHRHFHSESHPQSFYDICIGRRYVVSYVVGDDIECSPFQRRIGRTKMGLVSVISRTERHRGLRPGFSRSMGLFEACRNAQTQACILHLSLVTCHPLTQQTGTYYLHLGQ